LLHKYKWISDEDYSKRLEVAHYSYAQTLRNMCCNLKGFFVKVAQVMHSRPDICVEPFKTICTEFLSGCPAEPYHVIEKILKDELRLPLEEVFDTIEEKPLGAASVAQAHLAVLRSGERVVVKVQYPWARSLFEVDLSNMLLVTYWLNTTAYNELKGAISMYMNELDFAEEMRSLEYFWQAHRDAPSHICVRLPKPLSDLCSKRVIVMTYLEGKPLSSFLEAHTKQLGAIAGKDIDLSDVDFDKFQPPDPVQLKAIKSLFSIRNRVWNSMARSVNVSFGNFFRGLGRKNSTLVPYQSELPVAPEQLLHQLIDAIGYQMLILGKFTTDPHAGNILVDKNGSVGLIDFGQTWKAPLEDRKKFARLLLAAKRRDKKECVQRYLDMGFTNY
jgi:predicted unusual protein kinase regulating ubiquinone biosynthesis (AarF/ABC1/UbiB family)